MKDSKFSSLKHVTQFGTRNSPGGSDPDPFLAWRLAFLNDVTGDETAAIVEWRLPREDNRSITNVLHYGEPWRIRMVCIEKEKNSITMVKISSKPIIQ